MSRHALKSNCGLTLVDQEKKQRDRLYNRMRKNMEWTLGGAAGGHRRSQKKKVGNWVRKEWKRLKNKGT